MGFDDIGAGLFRHHYFRGIVDALTARGLRIYRPRLPAAASVPERAQALAAFVRGLPEERVNVIAHSMGGLDARFAIAHLGLGDKVAALVTVATPHQGTPVAVLAGQGPMRPLRRLARRLGLDTAGVEWLTPEAVARFNREVPADPRVTYFSVVANAGKLWRAPWLLPTWLYLRARGDHGDGMVPLDSQRFGEVLFELDADHFGQIGWSFTGDAAAPYLRIVDALAARGF